MTKILLAVQVIGLIVAFGYIVYTVSIKRAGEYTVLTAALSAAFINCFAYTMLLLSGSKDAALAIKPFDIMGSTLALYFLYRCAHEICGIKISKAINCSLLMADLFGIAAISSDKYLHLYYKTVVQIEDADFFSADVTYAAGFYVLLISMTVKTLIIICIAAYGCIKRVPRVSGRVMRSFFAVILPALAMVVYETRIFGYFNPSSLAVCASCIIITAAVNRERNFDMVNTARDRIIETMDDALIVTDNKMNIVDSNPAARKFFSVISDKNAKKEDVAKFTKELFEDGDGAVFEINGKCYEKHINRIFNSDGSERGWSALVIDATERKKYVDQLIEMRCKADMANNAKSDFLANMSHEIRTPMNAITGFAELCLQEKNYAYASDIKAAAKSLISIINDILDISKIEAGKLELVPSVYDTEAMLEDVVSIVYIQLGNRKNIEFKVDIDKRLPKKMYGDEVRLKQILINLLGNAVKFTKSGGISLSVKELSRAKEDISIIFKVSDTGIGIKKEDMSKLFENFQQVDTRKNREIEGSGLGLPISKTLAAMMNGSITVDSEYGKGSVFTVILTQKISDPSPISNSAARASSSEESDLIPYAPEARVLVVDDNKVNLNVTARLLFVYGIKAELADSGRKAIEMINSAYYDLVFMDHMMPELDGVDTTKLIRAQGDAYSLGIPIVALTANAVSGAREMFMAAGFNSFISKPIQIALLEKVLVEFLPKQMVKYVKRNSSRSESAADIFSEGLTAAAEAAAESDEEILIPNVDVKAGLSLCGGNAEAYLAVLKTFMETADDSILKIETYSQNRDYKNYTTEVHGLKSSALAIGAVSLSEMAKKLEEAGREEDYKQIQQDTPILIARFSEIAENIKPFVESEKSDDENKPLIDGETLRSKLNKVLEAIDDLDSHSAAKILDELMTYGYDDPEIEGEIEKSYKYVDNFAYEKAEASVRRVLEIV